jgi:hypothetical protein
MHDAILGAGSPWANQFPIVIVLVIEFIRSTDRARARLRGCMNAASRYLSGPRTPVASRRSAHLVLQSGAESANEVAQIINQKNNSLKEGASKEFAAKQNAKSN